MKNVPDFSDERGKGLCIHCTGWLPSGDRSNRDHVPTRALLREPYPDNLPVVQVCRTCNESFSHDEEYVAAFLAVVLSGSTSPPDTQFPRAARTLQRGHALRGRIEASRGPDLPYSDGSGATPTWRPEEERFRRVLVKNARGHAFHELGEPMMRPPERAVFASLPILAREDRAAFEDLTPSTGLWPEVGSRLLTRMVEGTDMRDDGWIIVQDSTYRYALILSQAKIEVRIVISEYLGASVTWSAEF